MPIIYKFFKDFTNHRKKINKAIVFCCRTFSNILETPTTGETLLQSGKEHSLRNILKSLASMCESLGSQIFRATIGIQSEPDTFDESRLVMTFLINFGVTEALCSFRLALEEKAGKKTPESSILEFLEEFLANKFALSDAEDNTSGPCNIIEGMADLPVFTCVKNTISSLPKLPRAMFLGGDSICKHFLAYASLAASGTLSRQLLACF